MGAAQYYIRIIWRSTSLVLLNHWLTVSLDCLEWWLVIDALLTYIRSCSRHREWGTVWWLSDPLEPVKPAVYTHWWRPWQIVENPIKRWEWTLRPSQPLRCSDVWMSPPMTGRMVSSLLSGEELWKLKKGNNSLLFPRSILNFDYNKP